jgi:hypothetical protein
MHPIMAGWAVVPIRIITRLHDEKRCHELTSLATVNTIQFPMTRQVLRRGFLTAMDEVGGRLRQEWL